MTGGALLAVAQLESPVLPVLVIVGALAQFALTFVWQHRPRVLSAVLSALGITATMALVGWQWATYAEGGVVQPQSLLAALLHIGYVTALAVAAFAVAYRRLRIRLFD